jgi:hypothetical protein
MPAIKLTDIPNAGGIIAPRFAQLGGSAAMDPNAMRGVAKDMQLQTYNLNAFAGEAIGMGKIGDAMSDAATLGIRFATKMAEAKENDDQTRADTLMRIALEKQANDQDTTPVEKWQEKWASNVADTRKQISEIGMSKNTFAKLSPTMDRWAELSKVKIEGQANQKRIEGYRMNTKANAVKKMADDDYEGAFAAIDEGVKKGVFSEEQGKLEKAMMQDDIIRKSKVQRDANVASDIIKNPIGAEADLEKAIQTGKSELFPHLTEKSDLVRAYSNARSEASVYRNNIEDDVDQLILSGQMTKPEDIRNVAEGVLPERRILAAIDTLSKTPAEMEKALAMRPTLLAMVDAYDANKDDKNRSEYLKIKDSIRQLPEGERGELLSSLRDKWNNPKETTPVNEATSQLKTLFTKGQFGTWKEDDGKMADAEVPKFLAAGKKFAGFKSNLENWAKANPKEARDQTKVYEKLNEILKADKEIQTPKSGGSSWWYPSSWFAPSKPAISTDDVRKKADAPPKTSKADGINKKSSKEDIAKAEGKVTSYGFKGDAHSDSNSRAGIGAWDNKLKENSLAISPDIEGKFKAAGIGEGDPVELTLADGSTVVRNWDDRTMQDKQAIEKFGKPLTGRFDFHSPGGKQKNDGMAVLSFRKAPNA